MGIGRESKSVVVRHLVVSRLARAWRKVRSRGEWECCGMGTLAQQNKGMFVDMVPLFGIARPSVMGRILVFYKRNLEISSNRTGEGSGTGLCAWV